MLFVKFAGFLFVCFAEALLKLPKVEVNVIKGGDRPHDFSFAYYEPQEAWKSPVEHHIDTEPLPFSSPPLPLEPYSYEVPIQTCEDLFNAYTITSTSVMPHQSLLTDIVRNVIPVHMTVTLTVIDNPTITNSAIVTVRLAPRQITSVEYFTSTIFQTSVQEFANDHPSVVQRTIEAFETEVVTDYDTFTTRTPAYSTKTLTSVQYVRRSVDVEVTQISVMTITSTRYQKVDFHSTITKTMSVRETVKEIKVKDIPVIATSVVYETVIVTKCAKKFFKSIFDKFH